MARSCCSTPGRHRPPLPYAPAIDLMAERGLRYVAFSRAGYGSSTRRPGRSVADVVDDARIVLDHVGAERAVTIGWSGGGPHALACAALLPDRIRAVATLASVAPYPADGLDYLAGMGAENIEEFNAALEGPEALIAFKERNWPIFREVTADQVAEALGDLVDDVDRGSLTGEFADYAAAGFREALRESYWGWFDDDMAMIRPWGFDLDVDQRARCTSGRAATTGWCRTPTVNGWPPTSPRAMPHLFDEHGHLSLAVDSMGSVLDELVASRTERLDRPSARDGAIRRKRLSSPDASLGSERRRHRGDGHRRARGAPRAVPRPARERRHRHRGRGVAGAARVGRCARPVRALPGHPADPLGRRGAPIPSKITIFRGPLVRANRTPERLVAAVTDTVYHEIAHHFGISDARLHELQAERTEGLTGLLDGSAPGHSNRRRRGAPVEPETMRDRGGLRPVPRAELVEDVGGVDADGLATDEQGVGDLLVRPTGGDEPEDLRLAVGQAEPGGGGPCAGSGAAVASVPAEVEACVAGERLDLVGEWPRAEPLAVASAAESAASASSRGPRSRRIAAPARYRA